MEKLELRGDDAMWFESRTRSVMLHLVLLVAFVVGPAAADVDESDTDGILVSPDEDTDAVKEKLSETLPFYLKAKVMSVRCDWLDGYDYRCSAEISLNKKLTTIKFRVNGEGQGVWYICGDKNDYRCQP